MELCSFKRRNNAWKRISLKKNKGKKVQKEKSDAKV